MSDVAPLFAVNVGEVASPSAYLGALGMTGLTSWIGIRDIGKPQPAETVVVSAPPSAVGLVAGQLAKADGARVVGIAGGAEKCRLLTEELGFDAAVDYRADDWAKSNSGRPHPTASTSTSRTSAAPSWTRSSRG
ncbi:zinc-binding dehydrogenase [Mycobacterium tilburgii]|uniref:zinc-binding dehydrogenase n=1 Tax=Mycobacterium tilburgii TaxID=44467 RepID=UPI0021B2DB41|nr:zinc-binding dehydrogenase [Mycobacterium tilburgii]